MAECVHARMMYRFLGDTLLALAIEAISLGLRKDVLAALIFIDPSFNSGHMNVLGEETATIHSGEFHGADTVLALVLLTRALCVEMVVARGAGEDLALFRDAQALGI